LISPPLSARYKSDKTSTPATLAQTASVAQLPASIIVRAGSAALVDGQTTVDATLELAGATDEQKVGVLSVDVRYDATAFKASACTVSNNFDLLLCNIATPGVIQLAGVAASGVRSDVKVADLSFEILQSDHLYTLLEVQLDIVADAEGATINAAAQHGQIGTPCIPGSEGCAISAVIYLPLVHR
jgi:hypothetical protein